MLATSSLLVLFVASAWLSPRYGAEGAASAVLLTYVFWVGASALALHRLNEPAVDVLQLIARGFRRRSITRIGGPV